MMKKTLIRLIAMLLIVSFSTVFFACGGDNGENRPPVVCEKHDYQVIEDRPHSKPDEYGVVVLQCSECNHTYEQKYFGHSIKGCEAEPLFDPDPTIRKTLHKNNTKCYGCNDIKNHTCQCGEVCDVNVFYRYASNNRIAIYGAYFYRNSLGGKNIYFGQTQKGDMGPKLVLATIFDGRIVTEVDPSAFQIAYFRYTIYFPGLLEKIGDRCATGCNVMAGVWIPKTLKSIGILAFGNNGYMKSITYEGTCLQFDDISKGSDWLGAEPGKTIPGYGNGGNGCKLVASDGTIALN